MSGRNFVEMLRERWAAGSCVCVGLDSEYLKIPEVARRPGVAETLFAFNRGIVDETHDLVCAYKLQSAFYEAEGLEGFKAMARTVDYIRSRYKSVPVIYDAKRADIGNTNEAYARAIFDVWRFDAVTLHPYLGIGALKPFLDRQDVGCIILCRTSNPEAREFQDLTVTRNGIVMSLWAYLAYQVVEVWNGNGNCALVVGATYPEELRAVRQIVGDIPILIPGIGAQGGDVEETVKVGKDSRGEGMIINSSRGIIFASSGEDFAEAARRETLRLRDLINQYR